MYKIHTNVTSSSMLRRLSKFSSVSDDIDEDSSTLKFACLLHSVSASILLHLSSTFSGLWHFSTEVPGSFLVSVMGSFFSCLTSAMASNVVCDGPGIASGLFAVVASLLVAGLSETGLL